VQPGALKKTTAWMMRSSPLSSSRTAHLREKASRRGGTALAHRGGEGDARANYQAGARKDSASIEISGCGEFTE
jgi:hypothetical protein